jgi:hypothetical protein
VTWVVQIRLLIPIDNPQVTLFTNFSPLIVWLLRSMEEGFPWGHHECEAKPTLARLAELTIVRNRFSLLSK